MAPTPLTDIAAAQKAILAAQDRLDRAVRRARNAGHTWSEIGATLGTTRSAAQQRFRNVGADAPLKNAPVDQ